MTSRMFTPGRLGNLELKNRIVRSAVWMALADEQGQVTDAVLDCYRALAEGGIGLIIAGYSYVQPNGQQAPGQTAIWSDDHVAGLKKLTDVVHEAGGMISTQLVHCAPQTTPGMIGGETPGGPSAVEHEMFGTPRELTTEEVKGIVASFGEAARRSVRAGFDAVQIHGAHGYLVSQFLSPKWNVRTDAYGGSLENRMRFAVEVYEAVRANAGDLPVFIKLNLTDFVDGSTTPDDALPLAERLAELGIDGIEVSAGGPLAKGKGPARNKIEAVEDEAYLMDLARMTRARTKAKCAIIGMGGFRSPEVIESALASGDVDLVSIARPFIREPGLVARWAAGDLSRADCISCNGCFKSLKYGEGILCVPARKEREKAAEAEA